MKKRNKRKWKKCFIHKEPINDRLWIQSLSPNFFHFYAAFTHLGNPGFDTDDDWPFDCLSALKWQIINYKEDLQLFYFPNDVDFSRTNI